MATTLESSDNTNKAAAPEVSGLSFSSVMTQSSTDVLATAASAKPQGNEQLPGLALTGLSASDNSSPTPAGSSDNSASLPQTYKMGDGMGSQKPDPEIKQLQVELNNLKYGTGGTDGEFGAATKQAVTEFQKANSLPQSGELDPATQKELSDPNAVKNTDPKTDVDPTTGLKIIHLKGAWVGGGGDQFEHWGTKDSDIAGSSDAFSYNAPNHIVYHLGTLDPMGYWVGPDDK